MTTEFTIDALTMSVAWQQATETSILLVAHQDGLELERTRVVRMLHDSEVTIGRSRAATIVADHEKVSRLHAKFVRRGDRVFVSDLDSRNGTSVNGTKIVAETEIRPGDEIIVGPVAVMLTVSSRLKRASLIVEPDVFESRLRAEIDRARRYQRHVSVAALRVIGSDSAIESMAMALREMDMMADYGEDHYVILLPELEQSHAIDLLQRLATAAATTGTSLRAGIATAPTDAVSFDAIMTRARLALVNSTSSVGVASDHGSSSEPKSSAIVVSSVMRNVYNLVERVADSNITVLVVGETGSGKELVAQAVSTHATARKDKPYVKLNCASLPENLLESELFGHERGSFTGADKRKIGFFEAASGGTLFLDEIGEFPVNLQAKLLRVLETKKITRVGGTEEIAVDTRVVVATHRDLEAEVKLGRFREDLYFRISAFTIVVPPLRDRADEILPLAEHFVRLCSPGSNVSFTDEARAALQAHDWPGNVRELRNAIERAAVLQSNGTIRVSDFPDRVQDAALRGSNWNAAAASDGGMRDQIGAVERAALVRALEQVNNNQTRAAKALGISRRALIYKMEKYGLKAPPAKDAES
jgi:two-component system, NtrC family, response regulator AtoC